MRWKLGWLGLFLGLGLSGQAAADQFAPLNIADSVLQFPLDPGYQSVRTSSPRIFELLTAAQPPSLRLVDSFYSESDLKRTLLGLGSPESSVFSVQVLRDSENMRISDADWKTGKPIMVRSMGDLDMAALSKKYSEQASAQLSQAASTPISLKMEALSKPTIYWVEGDSIRFMMLVPVNGSVGSESLKDTMVAAGAVVRIRERLVYVYLYHSYKDEQSTAQLRVQFDQILQRFFAANAAVPAPAAPDSEAASAARIEAADAASGAPAKAGKAPE